MANNIGDRIREARMANNLTLDELAQRMGYTSRSAISHIERGERKVSSDKLKSFAKALNVDVNWLIGDSDEKPVITEEDSISDLVLRLTPENITALKNYAEFLIRQQKYLNRKRKTKSDYQLLCEWAEKSSPKDIKRVLAFANFLRIMDSLEDEDE